MLVHNSVARREQNIFAPLGTADFILDDARSGPRLFCGEADVGYTAVSQSRQRDLVSDERLRVALLRAAFHPSQPGQAKKGFGIEPLLRTLTAKVRHEQFDLAPNGS